MEDSQRATHAVVDLGAVRDNTRALCGLLGRHTRLLAVVKADGYGHGAVPVARAALAGGASWLGVACVDEGVALRRGGIGAPVLVLGPVAPLECPVAVAHGLAVALGTVEVAKALSAATAAGARTNKGRGGHPAAVHIEVDTGMNRHGVRPDELPALLGGLRRLPGLRVKGLFTHFAHAESPAAPTTAAQLTALLAARETVSRAVPGGGADGRAGASIATPPPGPRGKQRRHALHGQVAPGYGADRRIALYGYPPDREDDEDEEASVHSELRGRPRTPLPGYCAGP